MVELRKHARVPCNLHVSCELSGGPVVTGVARDISVAGVFVEAEAQPAFGTAVRISLELPGIDGLSVVSGLVRWAKPDGFGVQFGTLGVRETHGITELMRDAT